MVRFPSSLSGLDVWRHEPSVLVYACLAIAAFAKRAVTESTRIRLRSPTDSPVRAVSRKIVTSAESETGTMKIGKQELHHIEISIKPVSFQPQDASDVTSIVRVIKMHITHRKLVGAACSALAALVRCSDTHAQAILKQVHAFPSLLYGNGAMTHVYT